MYFIISFQNFCCSLEWFSFSVLQTRGTRDVFHFHYTVWPDFGVPESPEEFVNFLFSVYAACPTVFESAFPPLVVHCAAGVGRSGTFCLVDTCLTMVGGTWCLVLSFLKYIIISIIKLMVIENKGAVTTTVNRGPIDQRWWVRIPPTAEINFCRALALRVYSVHSVKWLPVFGGRGPLHRSGTWNIGLYHLLISCGQWLYLRSGLKRYPTCIAYAHLTCTTLLWLHGLCTPCRARCEDVYAM